MNKRGWGAGRKRSDPGTVTSGPGSGRNLWRPRHQHGTKQLHGIIAEAAATVVVMSRIAGIDPAVSDERTRKVFEAQTQRWGAPLGPHLVYARRPSIYRGARAMWAGLDESGLLDPGLVALLNRRVAALVGCVF